MAGAGNFTHVFISRPLEDAERLSQMLSPLGVETIVQPAQEFSSRTLGDEDERFLCTLKEPALLIFTSPRSVVFGLPQLPPPVLDRATIAAIGPATARELAAAGRPPQIEPEQGFTSEALLEALHERGEAGGQALLICAPGGRTKLTEELRKAGWKVRPLNVYRRKSAEIRAEAVAGIERAGRLLSVWTSAEAMNSLSQRLPPSAWYALCRGDWLVISDRLKRLARAFGPPRVYVSAGPGNADLVNSIRTLVRV